jgi:hypothetical protein
VFKVGISVARIDKTELNWTRWNVTPYVSASRATFHDAVACLSLQMMEFDSRTVIVGHVINTVSLGQRFLRWLPSSPVRINAPRLAVFHRRCGNSVPEIGGEQHTWLCVVSLTQTSLHQAHYYTASYSWILDSISRALPICPINVRSISHSYCYSYLSSQQHFLNVINYVSPWHVIFSIPLLTSRGPR